MSEAYQEVLVDLAKALGVSLIVRNSETDSRLIDECTVDVENVFADYSMMYLDIDGGPSPYHTRVYNLYCHILEGLIGKDPVIAKSAMDCHEACKLLLEDAYRTLRTINFSNYQVAKGAAQDDPRVLFTKHIKSTGSWCLAGIVPVFVGGNTRKDLNAWLSEYHSLIYPVPDLFNIIIFEVQKKRKNKPIIAIHNNGNALLLTAYEKTAELAWVVEATTTKIKQPSVLVVDYNMEDIFSRLKYAQSMLEIELICTYQHE